MTQTAIMNEPAGFANLDSLIATSSQRVMQALGNWLPEPDSKPSRLHQAMRYASLSDGKHIRPLLVYATGLSLGQDLDTLDGPACAVELVHAYSLVHDDLPAMDDYDLRRGQPTCHKAFGEAIAILAGDALQTLAFDILSRDPRMDASAEQRLAMVSLLARASGSRGMAGGQAIDLLAVGSELDLATLENMHNHKTGALIRCSVGLAALNDPTCEPDRRSLLDTFAHYIGLAFQIRDDILDVTGDTAVIGKQQGADLEREKPTYVSQLGLDGARQRADDLAGHALQCLQGFGGDAAALRRLAEYIVRRSY